ncbi:MAG: response regulator transcription factor [Chloroflexota bacterium]|nr:MAG: response regulator transcription factor [Chloroflexota bacterium]
MKKKVLVIEDNPYTSDMVRKYLSRHDYEVLTANDGEEGLRLAREENPALILLDLMLPGIDGTKICRTLREESAVPIIMLTARVEEEDRVAGLEIGADDYITKPFSLKELIARMRAVLRRLSPDEIERGPSQLTYGDIKVDVNSRQAHIGGTEVNLTPIEFHILVLLVREPKKVFSREEIIARVFDIAFDGFDRAVDAHISRLRRKLKTEVSGYIQTVYGRGYRLSHD